jgi:ATP-dependent helicase HrpB
LIESANVVLHAPPGAGKTTIVPLVLADEPWTNGQRILMLEPRRIAASAAASRMARLLDEHVGATVGIRTRAETRVGRNTRIEVITEGVLTRMIRHDPTLDGVALVIFDEFHERSLQADVGLALVLASQAQLRPELRVLIMSATIDSEPIARLLAATVVSAEGHSFPVETRYRPPRPDVAMEAAVARTVRDALAEHDGDVLVFLPGAAEIRRTTERLNDGGVAPNVAITPLFGMLPPDEQDRAIRPAPAGTRKVVLATSIAETSLTIEGVRVVVDSGLARRPRFSARTGMTALETVRVSRASAGQRRGRAGRVAPGVCYRLWEEHENHHLLPHAPPEILEADLAPVALDLAAAGIDDPSELRWLDPPPSSAYSQARELLAELEAIDEAGRLTRHGAALAGLPLHPRLGHLVVRGMAVGGPGQHSRLACDLAALLSERDIVRTGRGAQPDPDVRSRLELLRGRGTGNASVVDQGGLRRVRDESRRLQRLLTESGLTGTTNRATGVGGSPNDDLGATGLLLAFAYPDRIGRRRRGEGQRGRYILRNGTGAELPDSDALGSPELIVAAETDGKRPESRIFLAAPLEEGDLLEHFGNQLRIERVVEWSDADQRVTARSRTRLGAIVLEERQLSDAQPAEVAAALGTAIARRGIDSLPWSDTALRFRRRVAFMRRREAGWPDMSTASLELSVEEWLAPRLHGMRSLDDLRRLDLHAALMEQLDWRQRRRLDEMAPTHLTVPTGSNIAIDYTNADAPSVAVRIQELFGLDETPSIAGGVKLTLELLSPAHRPVQITRDLPTFWRTSYFDVRKEMKGRYPKHPWPDDPVAARPTKRATRGSGMEPS